MDFAEPIVALIPGTTGRVLAVLTGTERELSTRAIARLASVSHAQAARVLPGLAELGVVERRDVPPASLYRLVPEHVAAGALIALGRAPLTFIEDLAERVAALQPPPGCVAAFGSFARHQARADSDVDLLVVRPTNVDADDAAWRDVVDAIRGGAERLSGNRVEILEVAQRDVRTLIRSKRPLWHEIVRDAVVVYGPPLNELR